MEGFIMRALAGSHEDFSLLYDRYAPAALRLSRAITRDADLAADAVQEAFLRAYRKGYQCRSDGKFESWFFRIVINESKRALVRRPAEEALTGEEGGASFSEQSDLSLTISGALEKLSEEHRTILVLRFLMDCSEKEIATILRRPVGTVKSRLHYAKTALAKELGEGGAER